MVRLLLFYIYARFRHYNLLNYLGLFSKIFFLISVLAFIYKFQIPLDTPTFSKRIARVIFIFLILTVCFPSIRPYSNYINQSFPLKPFNRLIINFITNNFLSSYSFLVLIGILVLNTFENLHVDLTNLLLAYVSALVFRSSIQVLVTNFEKNIQTFLLLISIAFFISLLITDFFPDTTLKFTSLLSILILSFVWFYASIPPLQIHNDRLKLGSKLYLNLLFKNKFVLFSYSFTYVFKICLLIILATKENPEFQNSMANYFIIAFFTPLTLFTYVFNNYFGFFPKFWYATDSSPLPPLSKFLVLFYPQFFLLSIDFGFILLANVFIDIAPSIYVASTLLLFVTGIYTSALNPRKLPTSIFSIKPPVPIGSNLVSICLVFFVIFGISHINSLVTWSLIVLLFLFSIWMCKNYLDTYITMNSQIKKRLFFDA